MVKKGFFFERSLRFLFVMLLSRISSFNVVTWIPFKRKLMKRKKTQKMKKKKWVKTRNYIFLQSKRRKIDWTVFRTFFKSKLMKVRCHSYNKLLMICVNTKVKKVCLRAGTTNDTEFDFLDFWTSFFEDLIYFYT